MYRFLCSVLFSPLALNAYGWNATPLNGDPAVPTAQILPVARPEVSHFPEPVFKPRSATLFAHSLSFEQLSLRPSPQLNLNNKRSESDFRAFLRRVERLPRCLPRIGGRLLPNWQFIPTPTFSCSLLTPPQSPLGFLGFRITVQPPPRKRR